MLHLPTEESSLWREAYTSAPYPPLKENMAVDAVVIGAGITGLTTAYLLKEAGYSVAVLDKDTVGGGTTGRTTGKVTAQHELIYSELQARFGMAAARLYGQANQAALGTVRRIVKAEKIKGVLFSEDNYVYTADPGQVETLKQEANIAAQLDLPASYETKTPLPFPVLGAVKFTSQARIHAQEYVAALAKAIHGNGSYVFEHSNVIAILDRAGRVHTRHGSVNANHIVVATNVPTLPLMARGGYCLFEYPTESYIVVGKLAQSFPGMYISPDSGNYSVLPFEIKGQSLVLVGGEGHISGLRGSTTARYRRLADYAEQKLGVTEITHHWSDRDYLAYDGVPLIGKPYPWSQNLYVATAFRKWGLTNGTVAAIMLRDAISGQHNSWADLFAATRGTPLLHIPRVAAKYLLRK